jgi:hypothetical protein
LPNRRSEDSAEETLRGPARTQGDIDDDSDDDVITTTQSTPLLGRASEFVTPAISAAPSISSYESDTSSVDMRQPNNQTTGNARDGNSSEGISWNFAGLGAPSTDPPVRNSLDTYLADDEISPVSPISTISAVSPVSPVSPVESLNPSRPPPDLDAAPDQYDRRFSAATTSAISSNVRWSMIEVRAALTADEDSEEEEEAPRRSRARRTPEGLATIPAQSSTPSSGDVSPVGPAETTRQTGILSAAEEEEMREKGFRNIDFSGGSGGASTPSGSSTNGSTVERVERPREILSAAEHEEARRGSLFLYTDFSNLTSEYPTPSTPVLGSFDISRTSSPRPLEASSPISLLRSAIQRNDTSLAQTILRDTTLNLNTAPYLLADAIMQQRTEIVSLFTTRNDLDLNLFSRYGKTPLVHALDSPSVYTLLQILLARKDLNPNLPDNEGRFPLLLAVEYGMVEAVRMLLQRGDLDINKPGILSTAVRRDVRILEMLLQRHDVDVNRTDDKGKRAIEVAVEAGNTEVVDLLVGRGDVEVRDADWEAIKKLRDAKKD